ncbi:MAG TPA: hypothetical protein VFQ80_13775 [Thermomicrobiales bacterium]|jgi:hypothetical protein|nr:hypothetical protein [Thermomicrobiales bacterium]
MPIPLLQTLLQALAFISVLLTLRAIEASSWPMMWGGALVSLIFCLVALWSIGSLLYLATCLQLAAAVGIRRSARVGSWAILLLAGVATFGVVVFGMGFARLETFWPVALPLAFALWSLLLVKR